MSWWRQSWRRWCIRMLKAVAGAMVLMLLGFLLIQVLLATPWMRGKLAAKFSQRIGGQEVAISDLDWTPWGGATVHGLRVEQPEALRDLVPAPLLEVGEIHAWPDYAAALRGEWPVSEVTVVRPEIHVTAEMLVSLAASGMPEALPPPPPPVVADDLVQWSAPMARVPGLDFEAVSADELESVPPMVGSVPADIHIDVSTLPVSPEEPERELPVEKDEEPSLSGSDEKKAEEASVSGSDEESSEASSQTAPTADVPARKGFRMRIRDGSFEFIRVGQSDRLAVIEGVHFDLPLFVDEGQTSNSIGLLEVFGQTIEENLEFTLTSRGRKVTLTLPEEGKGTKLSGYLHVGLLAGLPIQADLELRLPSFGPVNAGDSMIFETGNAAGSVQAGGWLLSPGSINGVAKLEVDQVAGKYAGQTISFDYASGELLFSGGLVQSPDFRLIGDEASLLGNGWATSRDGAAVVRVVVPFSLVGMLNHELNELVPESVFTFEPLKPDNRWFSDVSLWSEKNGWSVLFGDGGKVMALDDFLD